MAKNYRERQMAENAHEQRNFNYFEAGIINVLNGNIVDRDTMEAKIILNAFNHEELNTLSMISHNKKIVYEDETTFLTPL
uniref:Uncharacterized protein n=1 Tax=Panagrolaimus superbus TaxID=310955 RepID=A0A914YK54_9BILA